MCLAQDAAAAYAQYVRPQYTLAVISAPGTLSSYTPLTFSVRSLRLCFFCLPFDKLRHIQSLASLEKLTVTNVFAQPFLPEQEEMAKYDARLS